MIDVNLLAPGADHRRAARGRRCCNDGGADRLRLVDERHRRQRGPDELRDLEGRRDRPGRRATRRRSPSAGITINAVAPGLHRDADDRGDADRDARGRPADELAAPGRAAGRRGRDDRLVRPPGLGGRQRQRRPRLRPEPARAHEHASTSRPTRSLCARAAADPGRLAAAVRRPAAAATMPDDELALDGVRIDRDRLAAYARVCGFTLRDELPPTYPHVLAFPLHMELMTDGRFPFRAVGLVHIANRIVQHRPIGVGEALDAARPRDAAASRTRRAARSRSSPRRASATSWSGRTSRTIPRARRWRRRRDGGRAPRRELARLAGRPRRGELPERPRPPLRRRLRRPQPDPHARPDAPSRSASRARSPTACGRRRAAWRRCEGTLPDAFAVDVSFKKPILLPATVDVRRAGNDGRFAVRVAQGRPHMIHLEGTMTS